MGPIREAIIRKSDVFNQVYRSGGALTDERMEFLFDPLEFWNLFDQRLVAIANAADLPLSDDPDFEAIRDNHDDWDISEINDNFIVVIGVDHNADPTLGLQTGPMLNGVRRWIIAVDCDVKQNRISCSINRDGDEKLYTFISPMKALELICGNLGLVMTNADDITKPAVVTKLPKKPVAESKMNGLSTSLEELHYAKSIEVKTDYDELTMYARADRTFAWVKFIIPAKEWNGLVRKIADLTMGRGTSYRDAAMALSKGHFVSKRAFAAIELTADAIVPETTHI